MTAPAKTPKVLISDSMSSQAVEIFRNRGIDVTVSPKLSPDELKAVIGEYDGLAIRSSTKATADLLSAATNLKVIGRAGIGVDNVDVPAATARGVVVMNTPFGNAVTTAEHAIAMIFAVARQLPLANASTQAGKWEKTRFMGAEITGKTLGLIGAGNIGSIVASRALGLKMKVVAYDPFLSEERAERLGVTKADLDTVLTQADFLTLHVPMNDQTRNIVSAEALAKMKKGAYVINCARGGLVDEVALREAILSGHIAGAGFDVFSVEPAKENPLFGLENVVVTPHLGASTTEAQEKVALQVAEQMSDYLLDGAITNAVNAPSLTAEEARVLAPYLDLARRLGSMAGQLTDEEIKAIRVTYEGHAAEAPAAPLTQTVVQAVLGAKIDSINMVNALEVAKQYGVTVASTKSEGNGDFQTLITVEIQTPDRSRSLKGTLAGRQARLVEVKGIALESTLRGDMLYVTNKDQPGLVGALGNLLAEAKINIANFHLGRISEGGDAVVLVEVDTPISPEVMAKIRGLKQVTRAAALRFGA